MSGRKVAWAWLSVAALCGSSVVHAQSQPGASSETGSLISRRVVTAYGTAKRDRRQFGRAFAQCIVERHPVVAARLATTQPGGDAYEALLKQLYTDECMGIGQYRVSQQLARFSIFEALYSRHYGKVAPSDLSKIKPIDYALGLETFSPHAGSTVALAQFGDCVARADARDAHDLVMSAPESRGETAALGGLGKYLGPCVPKGQNITFSRSMLRGAIAEGLFRLSNARATSGTEIVSAK